MELSHGQTFVTLTLGMELRNFLSVLNGKLNFQSCQKTLSSFVQTISPLILIVNIILIVKDISSLRIYG